KGSDSVNKKAFVAMLIANAMTAFGPEDEEFLMGLPEDKLRKLEPKKDAPAATPAPAENTSGTPTPTPAPATNSATPAPRAQTFEELMANAAPEMRDSIMHGMRLHQERKKDLIAKITGNSRNRFTVETLN